MSTKTIIAALLCAAITAACEKNYYFNTTENQETQTQTSGSDDGDDDSGDGGEEDSDVLSVAQAQAATDETEIVVVGYIVASCAKSMKNTDFTAPFEGSTAIVLADEPVDTANAPLSPTDPCLFPVCISTYTDTRESLNLEDNPGLWNQRIMIAGWKKNYLNRPGISQVWGYRLLDQ